MVRASTLVIVSGAVWFKPTTAVLKYANNKNQTDNIMLCYYFIDMCRIEREFCMWYSLC
jgi:hypothetical protein